jgi:hypothetical protein
VTWIYVLIVVIAIAAVAKYGWLFLRPTIYFFNGIARIECRAPRLKPNEAAMTPEIVRERLTYNCRRWKGHDGAHEAEVDVEIEPGVRRKTLVEWE